MIRQERYVRQNRCRYSCITGLFEEEFWEQLRSWGHWRGQGLRRSDLGSVESSQGLWMLHIIRKRCLVIFKCAPYSAHTFRKFKRLIWKCKTGSLSKLLPVYHGPSFRSFDETEKLTNCCRSCDKTSWMHFICVQIFDVCLIYLVQWAMCQIRTETAQTSAIFWYIQWFLTWTRKTVVLKLCLL